MVLQLSGSPFVTSFGFYLGCGQIGCEFIVSGGTIPTNTYICWLQELWLILAIFSETVLIFNFPLFNVSYLCWSSRQVLRKIQGSNGIWGSTLFTDQYTSVDTGPYRSALIRIFTLPDNESLMYKKTLIIIINFILLNNYT